MKIKWKTKKNKEKEALNFDILKEPRGILKCLEILLAIFSFSCETGYRGELRISQRGANPSTIHTVEGHFKYPFGTGVLESMLTDKDGWYKADIDIRINENLTSEFFVFIGVFCFLYSLGVLICYIVFQENSKVETVLKEYKIKPPIIDFVGGAVWTCLWLVSSCAQASAVTNIKRSTNAGKLVKTLEFCKGGLTCEVLQQAKYMTLTVTVLLGFLNAFVWAGNLWFLWKETPWHNEKGKESTRLIPPKWKFQFLYNTIV